MERKTREVFIFYEAGKDRIGIEGTTNKHSLTGVLKEKASNIHRG